MRKVIRQERRKYGNELWVIETWYLFGFIPIYRSEYQA